MSHFNDSIKKRLEMINSSSNRNQGCNNQFSYSGSVESYPQKVSMTSSSSNDMYTLSDDAKLTCPAAVPLNSPGRHTQYVQQSSTCAPKPCNNITTVTETIPERKILNFEMDKPQISSVSNSPQASTLKNAIREKIEERKPVAYMPPVKQKTIETIEGPCGPEYREVIHELPGKILESKTETTTEVPAKVVKSNKVPLIDTNTIRNSLPEEGYFGQFANVYLGEQTRVLPFGLNNSNLAFDKTHLIKASSLLLRNDIDNYFKTLPGVYTGSNDLYVASPENDLPILYFVGNYPYPSFTNAGGLKNIIPTEDNKATMAKYVTNNPDQKIQWSIGYPQDGLEKLLTFSKGNVNDKTYAMRAAYFVHLKYAQNNSQSCSGSYQYVPQLEMVNVLDLPFQRTVSSDPKNNENTECSKGAFFTLAQFSESSYSPDMYNLYSLSPNSDSGNYLPLLFDRRNGASWRQVFNINSFQYFKSLAQGMVQTKIGAYEIDYTGTKIEEAVAAQPQDTSIADLRTAAVAGALPLSSSDDIGANSSDPYYQTLIQKSTTSVFIPGSERDQGTRVKSTLPVNIGLPVYVYYENDGEKETYNINNMNYFTIDSRMTVSRLQQVITWYAGTFMYTPKMQVGGKCGDVISPKLSELSLIVNDCGELQTYKQDLPKFYRRNSPTSGSENAFVATLYKVGTMPYDGNSILLQGPDEIPGDSDYNFPPLRDTKKSKHYKNTHEPTCGKKKCCSETCSDSSSDCSSEYSLDDGNLSSTVCSTCTSEDEEDECSAPLTLEAYVDPSDDSCRNNSLITLFDPRSVPRFTSSNTLWFYRTFVPGKPGVLSGWSQAETRYAQPIRANVYDFNANGGSGRLAKYSSQNSIENPVKIYYGIITDSNYTSNL